MERQIRYTAVIVVVCVDIVVEEVVIVIVDEDAEAMERQIRYAAEGDTQLAGDEAWAADTDNTNFTDCGLNI